MTNKNFVQLIVGGIFILTFLFEAFLYIYSSRNITAKSIIDVRNGNTKCLIMGDSHTQNAFRNNLKECTNLSVGGTSIPMIVDAIYSVEKNNDLNQVIIALDPHNFAEYRVNNYSNIFKNISEKFDPIYKPLFSMGIFKTSIKEQLFDHKSETSWMKLDKKLKIKVINERLKIHQPIKDFENSDYANIYKKLVSYLLSKKIKVYLIRTPVVPLYEEKLLHYISQDEWNLFVNQFNTKGAIYIDYKNIGFDSYNESYFTDEDHLNKEGSKVFTYLFEKSL